VENLLKMGFRIYKTPHNRETLPFEESQALIVTVSYGAAGEGGLTLFTSPFYIEE
jgi:hypothetical protein